MAERRIPLAVALLVLCNAVALGAQTAVAIGTRVRVQAERRYVGTVLALDSSQLMLELDRSHYTQTLPRAAVSALEVSRGRHRDTLRGTGIGLLAGAIGGAFIGLAGSTHSCKPSGYCFQVAEVSVGHNMVMFGGIGAGAGLAGRRRATEDRVGCAAVARPDAVDTAAEPATGGAQGHAHAD